jgi:hypothetical protein
MRDQAELRQRPQSGRLQGFLREQDLRAQILLLRAIH